MNISPEHRPLRLYRPWWSRRPVPLAIGALLLGGCAAFGLVVITPDDASDAAPSATDQAVEGAPAAERGA